MATVIWAQVESEMGPVVRKIIFQSPQLNFKLVLRPIRFVYTLNELWPLLLHDDTIEVGKKGK